MRVISPVTVKFSFPHSFSSEIYELSLDDSQRMLMRLCDFSFCLFGFTFLKLLMLMSLTRFEVKVEI